MTALEMNFDGLVGPSHNYSGLSYGNIASIKSQSTNSNPKAAALQGLEKMKFLADIGIPQAIIPPQIRPHLTILKRLGFSGNDQHILSQAYKQSPELFFACCSSASMWTANAATVSPSMDTADGKLHLTPANLSSKFHRSIEASFATQFFKKIFADTQFFKVHDPLPQGNYFTDEGAANHHRFCNAYADKGIELFVWGRSSFNEQLPSPKRFPARQTFEASQAIARKHLLTPERTIFVQQSPQAIDAGVFHNDVISVGNEYLFLLHEKAFIDTSTFLYDLKKKINKLVAIIVPEKRISFQEAVSTYLFNSQIVTLPNKTMRMIAPVECLENRKVQEFLQETVQDSSNPLSGIDFLNLRQSMANGGGPACLRLRIVMTDLQKAAMHQGIIFTDALYHQLKKWIEKYYRDQLSPKDLSDIQFLNEMREALNELSILLELGSLYDFQK